MSAAAACLPACLAACQFNTGAVPACLFSEALAMHSHAARPIVPAPPHLLRPRLGCALPFALCSRRYNAEPLVRLVVGLEAASTSRTEKNGKAVFSVRAPCCCIPAGLGVAFLQAVLSAGGVCPCSLQF